MIPCRDYCRFQEGFCSFVLEQGVTLMGASVLIVKERGMVNAKLRLNIQRERERPVELRKSLLEKVLFTCACSDDGSLAT